MANTDGNARQPMILVFAGPNGSGKTTITGNIDVIGEYTNADELAKYSGVSNIEAAKEVDKRRYDAISHKRDFTFETVLSSDYKLNLLRKAKSEGYFIKCFFILTISPDINIIRVKARVEQGGHSVDKDKIISRYYSSLENISELIDICDILHVYDNTDSIPKRIIRKHKDDITIFPNKYWSEQRIMGLISGVIEDEDRI